MATLNVVYPAGETKFDRAYYSEHHGPLVHANWDALGLKSLRYSFGEAALGGGPAPYHCIATLVFGSRAELDEAVGGSTAAAVFGDIPNFTDSSPTGLIGVEG